MKTIIGILGGMGPRATVAFEQLLLDRLPGSDQDLPTIFTINDGSIPDRSKYLLDAGPDPLPRMIRNAQVLENAGSTFICVPCNTACAPEIFDRLRCSVNIPVLSLIEEVGHYVCSTTNGPCYVLATEGTIRVRSFQNMLEQNNIRAITPPRAIQATIDALIRAIKQNDTLTINILSVCVKTAIQKSGCQTVILGCTELPLIKNLLVPTDIVAVDTLEVLAAACVRYTKAYTEEMKV